jgi:hypothetical protein
MHILFAAQSWPHPGHDQLSANQVIYELIRAFLQSERCEVSFVSAFRPDRRPDEATVNAARTALAAIGVNVLPPIELPDPPPIDRWRTLFMPQPRHFFPEAAHRAMANELVQSLRPDAVIVPWSEQTTQLFAEVDCLRVAYYGNPDPKNLRISSGPPFSPSRGLLKDWATRMRLSNFERLHLREMRRYDLFGNVAANDAEYYRRAGIPGAFYTRMVFIDRAPADWQACRDFLEAQAPKRIVANIGSQSATGNVLALHYLADHVLERLDRRLGGEYELVVAGGGRLPTELVAKLDHPCVVNVGFVDDIDRLLLSAPVFLCLNNATAYKVNQSRYLHVWSLGGCIVDDHDAALSLPVLVDGEHALLGSGPDEFVERIAEGLADKVTRRRIGACGRSAFLVDFNTEVICRDLMDRIRGARDVARLAANVKQPPHGHGSVLSQ